MDPSNIWRGLRATCSSNLLRGRGVSAFHPYHFRKADCMQLTQPRIFRIRHFGRDPESSSVSATGAFWCRIRHPGPGPGPAWPTPIILPGWSDLAVAYLFNLITEKKPTSTKFHLYILNRIPYYWFKTEKIKRSFRKRGPIKIPTRTTTYFKILSDQ